MWVSEMDDDLFGIRQIWRDGIVNIAIRGLR